MIVHQESIEIATKGRGFVSLDRLVRDVVVASGAATGLCTVFCKHTSCSLLIQENADPRVRDDFEMWLSRLAPDGDPAYTHRDEGPDDMAAHLRSALTQTSIQVPVTHGHLALGTWQSIFLVEHRVRPHRRTLIVHVAGT